MANNVDTSHDEDQQHRRVEVAAALAATSRRRTANDATARRPDREDRSLALRTVHAATWLELGVILREVDRPDEALEALDRALHLAPSCALAHLHRGALLASRGSAEAAVESVCRALALDPALRALVRERAEFAPIASSEALIAAFLVPAPR